MRVYLLLYLFSGIMFDDIDIVSLHSCFFIIFYFLYISALLFFFFKLKIVEKQLMMCKLNCSYGKVSHTLNKSKSKLKTINGKSIIIKPH